MIILHNPRCGKSREALAYLESHGFKPEIRLYLKDQLQKEEIAEIISKLKIQPEQWIRKKEAVYKQLKLKDKMLDTDWIVVLSNYPELIERPVIILENDAVIARDFNSLESFLSRNLLIR